MSVTSAQRLSVGAYGAEIKNQRPRHRFSIWTVDSEPWAGSAGEVVGFSGGEWGKVLTSGGKWVIVSFAERNAVI